MFPLIRSSPKAAEVGTSLYARQTGQADFIFMTLGNDTDTGKRIKLSPEALSKQVFVVGKTGTGKSTLMLNMMVEAAWNNEGFCFIDMHGDTAQTVLRFIPPDRINDIIWIDPTEDYVPNISIIEPNGSTGKIVSEADNLFLNLWPKAWYARSQWFFRTAARILLSIGYPVGIVGILKMMANKAYREKIMQQPLDEDLKMFLRDFETWTKPFREDVVTPVKNKVYRFIEDEFLKAVTGPARSSFRFRWAMDNRKIVICRIPRGTIGKEGSELLASLIVNKINNAALGRADSEERPPFTLYVDEFGSAVNGVDAHSLLSEGRKYGLQLVIASQELQSLVQGEKSILGPILGNCSTIIAFKISGEDAQKLDVEFYSRYAPEFYVGLDNYHFVIRTIDQGRTSTAYHVVAYPEPDWGGNDAYAAKIKDTSKRRFGVSKKKTYEKVNRFLAQ